MIVRVEVQSDYAHYTAFADVTLPSAADRRATGEGPDVRWLYVWPGGDPSQRVRAADWNGPELHELDERAAEAAIDGGGGDV